MIRIKTKEEISLLREGGKRHAFILNEIVRMVKPGVSTLELENHARALIEKGGDKPSFLNYKPYGAKRPYPAALCISINDEVVHGIPNENPTTLQEGDTVTLDLGLVHKGMFTDSAVTVGVGTIDENAQKLLKATEEALHKGIKAAKGGKTTGDIGFAIEQHIKPFRFGIVEELAGHGVGYSVHEDPYVPNYGDPGSGDLLKPGMIISIEPIINEVSPKIYLAKDGYTYKTKDGKRSAHFEHTILITKGDAEILTQ